MNNNYYIVYDYETDGTNPLVCDPVELSAVVIHPRKLEIVDKFYSKMKPVGIEDEGYLKEHLSTIEWHAKIRNISVNEVLEDWKGSPPQDIVWNNFVKFLHRYHKNPLKPTKYTCPIPVGYNIINFDNVITNRLAVRHNTKYVFSEVYKVDLLDTVFMWFESNGDVNRYNFDTMREYLGISSTGAHTAENDTECFAELFIRFMKLIRRTSSKVSFANSFVR